MKEIAGWLLHLEHDAGTFYRAVADECYKGHKLNSFFHHLAEEEAFHFHVMGSALEQLRKKNEKSADLTIDSSFRNSIESLLSVNMQKLKDGRLTEHDLLECMISIELAEWNDIFLYVVNALKSDTTEFMYAASMMQRHVSEIEGFLRSVPEGQELLTRRAQFPSFWRERILVVDDFEPVVEFLKAVLAGKGVVDTAANGVEALDKVKRQYFDVIISDVQMPVMDGISFYRKAVAHDKDIAGRFLFLTATPSGEQLDFLQEHNLRVLLKPAPIEEIKRNVNDILKGNKTRP